MAKSKLLGVPDDCLVIELVLLGLRLLVSKGLDEVDEDKKPDDN